MTRARTVMIIGIIIIICSLFQRGAEGFQTVSPCSALSVDNLSGIIGTYKIASHQPYFQQNRTYTPDPDQLNMGEIALVHQGLYDNLPNETVYKYYRKYNRTVRFYMCQTTLEGCPAGKFIQDLISKYNTVILAFRGVEVNAYFQIVISKTSDFAYFYGDPRNYLFIDNLYAETNGHIYQGDMDPILGSILELAYSVEGGNEPPRTPTPVPTSGTAVTVPVGTAPQPTPTVATSTAATNESTPKKWYEKPQYTISAGIIAVAVVGTIVSGIASLARGVQPSTRPNMRGNA